MLTHSENQTEQTIIQLVVSSVFSVWHACHVLAELCAAFTFFRQRTQDMPPAKPSQSGVRMNMDGQDEQDGF
jgi:hypothetical protein